MNPTLARNQRWLLSLLLLAAMTLFFSATHAQSIPAWAPNTAYAVNSKVTYQAIVYQCRQAHTSIVTWEPINTPALWLNIGADTGGGGGGGGGDTQAPTAPRNVRATGTTSSSVSLAWDASTDNVGVTRYDIVQNATTLTGSAATTFTSSGLTPSTTYTYSVRARDAAGNLSPASNQVSATTLPNTGGGGGGPVPGRTFVGYWHNFENGSGFIKLRDVSRDFDVINLSFAESSPGSRSLIQFVPDTRTSQAEIQSDVAQLKREGKKVLLSIGGANTVVELNNETDKQNFINSVANIITLYGLNGVDIDFEGSSLSLNAGDLDFRAPTTPKVINLISALRTLKSRFGSDFILSMAPETFYVQVGFQAYGGAAGAYLPVIHGVRDILTFIHVQHYNTGTVLGLDGVAYASATADFQVAMAEMLMTGFPVAGNPDRFFPALRPDQVMIGLPSSPQAAGSGYTPPAEVAKAINYLVRGQSYGGRYVLRNPGGYNNFRGVMTFSINWDRFNGFVFSRGVRPALNSLPATTAR
jgi:chitinase